MFKYLILFGFVLNFIWSNLGLAQTPKDPHFCKGEWRSSYSATDEEKARLASQYLICLNLHNKAPALKAFPRLDRANLEPNINGYTYGGWNCTGIQKKGHEHETVDAIHISEELEVSAQWGQNYRREFVLILGLTLGGKGLYGQSSNAYTMQVKAMDHPEMVEGKHVPLLSFVFAEDGRTKIVGSCHPEVYIN